MRRSPANRQLGLLVVLAVLYMHGLVMVHQMTDAADMHARTAAPLIADVSPCGAALPAGEATAIVHRPSGSPVTPTFCRASSQHQEQPDPPVPRSSIELS